MKGILPLFLVPILLLYFSCFSYFSLLSLFFLSVSSLICNFVPLKSKSAFSFQRGRIRKESALFQLFQIFHITYNFTHIHTYTHPIKSPHISVHIHIQSKNHTSQEKQKRIHANYIYKGHARRYWF